MEGLRDIQGLDQITAWPLALGWCITLATIIGISLTLSLFAYKRYKYRKSWQYRAYQKLQNVSNIQELSVELKFIAMQTKSREACAGLSGEKWLQWLEQNDPHGFHWRTYGQILLNAQYMPPHLATDREQLDNLINATKKWVNKC